MRKHAKSSGQQNMKILYAIASLSVVLIAACAYMAAATPSEEYVEMRVSSISFADNSATIGLEGKCSQFSFTVTKEEGESIDLILSNINAGGSESEGVPAPLTTRIIKSGSSFYGEIFSNEMIPMSVRTSLSEALAMSLKSGRPVYISSRLARKTC